MDGDPNRAARYGRVLLKLSGESFKGKQPFGIDDQAVEFLASQIRRVHDWGVGIGIVVGGGNFWRGAEFEKHGMDRANADHAGMLATVMNSLVLQDWLEREGVPVRTLTAIPMQTVAEPYILRRAIRHIERGRVVICAAGTGNPYMSTDTAASLRAAEMGAEVMMLAKNAVDGVYDADPNLDPDATKFEHITHQRALQLRLQVMDSTALSLAMDNGMPIMVFDIFVDGNLAALVSGGRVGTRITSDEDGEQISMPRATNLPLALEQDPRL